MKIFISWSGPLSRSVALLFHSWIPCVIQAAKPWVSSEDIASGTIWISEIFNELRDTEFGILCVTRENKEKPWIRFEAGALSKGLTTAKVCPFLVDLQTSELLAPLSQFNHTLPDVESVRKLIFTLNRQLGERELEEKRLNTSFETFWPKFEEELKKLLSTAPKTKAKELDTNAMFSQILELAQAQGRLLDRLILDMSMGNSTDRSIEHIRPRKKYILPRQIQAILESIFKNSSSGSEFVEQALKLDISQDVIDFYLRELAVSPEIIQVK